jgi:hypothetical protein
MWYRYELGPREGKDHPGSLETKRFLDESAQDEVVSAEES